MIVQFEDRLGRMSSTAWAQEEAQGFLRDLDLVVIEIVNGTLGQRFCVELLQDLFEALET